MDKAAARRIAPPDTTFLNLTEEAGSKDIEALQCKDANQHLLHASIAMTASKINFMFGEL